MPTVHDCVSQADRGILSPLLKSYNAILDSQPWALVSELRRSLQSMLSKRTVLYSLILLNRETDSLLLNIRSRLLTHWAEMEAAFSASCFRKLYFPTGLYIRIIKEHRRPHYIRHFTSLIRNTEIIVHRLRAPSGWIQRANSQEAASEIQPFPGSRRLRKMEPCSLFRQELSRKWWGHITARG